MKVLFVTNHIQDYMKDMVYHGLIDNGVDVYETYPPHYMMKYYLDSEQSTSSDFVRKFDGNNTKGFTVYCKLDHQPNVESPEVIIDKIKSKFYDMVIYGCVYTHPWFPQRQCLDYLEHVKEHYPKNKVHFIDGADEPDDFAGQSGLHEYGIVWKRELYDISIANPISFAIPESQFIDHIPTKEKIFGHVVPGYADTYIFEDEKSYYEDYAKSYYGRTCKKMGWDCLRHYEILANRSIPYFTDLKDCPPYIMTSLPKSLILETNKYAMKGKIHPQYDQICEYLFDFSKKNLTTKKLAQLFL
jgi:hypothetical protein